MRSEQSIPPDGPGAPPEVCASCPSSRLLSSLFDLGPLLKPENRAIRRWAFALAAAAIAIRLFFWWYTGRVWEDALIAVLHSENCASGLGLTHFRIGEPPVQGFSSPLGVLIPLMADLLHVGWGLPWIKLVSAFAGGLTVLFAAAIARHPAIALPRPLAVMIMAYVAFEHHQILWGMSGMETQLTTCVLLASIYFTIRAGESPPVRRDWAPSVRLGVALALCMYARPDLAFWTIVAGLYLLVSSPRRLPLVVATALALYAPWAAFTTLYYGSPIPNTIVAKGLGYPLWMNQPGLTRADIFQHVWNRLGGQYHAGSIFQPLGPSFAGHGTHFSHVLFDQGRICQAMIAAALLGAASAFVARRRAWLLLAGFTLVYAGYFTFGVAIVFGWYIIPFAAITLFLSAKGIEIVGRAFAGPMRTPFYALIAVTYTAIFIALLPRTFDTERRIQQDIENVVRKKAALYLADIMQPDQTVGCEALGYLSYHTHRTVYDWPGLASRRVVEYSRAHPDLRTLVDMLEALRPDFILIRPFELEEAREKGAQWLGSDYEVVTRFEADPEKTKDILLLSRNIDLCYTLLQKIDREPNAIQGDNQHVQP